MLPLSQPSKSSIFSSNEPISQLYPTSTITNILPTQQQVIPVGPSGAPMVGPPQNTFLSKMSVNSVESSQGRNRDSHIIKGFSFCSKFTKAVVTACKCFSRLFTKLLNKSDDKKHPNSVTVKKESSIPQKNLILNNKNKQPTDLHSNSKLPLLCIEYHKRTDGISINIDRKDPNHKKYSVGTGHHSLTNQVLTECKPEVLKLEKEVLSFAKSIEKKPFSTRSKSSVSQNHKILDQLDQLNIDIDLIKEILLRVPANNKDRQALLDKIDKLTIALNSSYKSYIKQSHTSKDYLVLTQYRAINAYSSLFNHETKKLEANYDQAINKLSAYIDSRLSFNKDYQLVFDGENDLSTFIFDPGNKLTKDTRNQMTEIKNNLLSRLNDIISSANKNSHHPKSKLIIKQAKKSIEKIISSFNDISKQPFCRFTLHHRNQITKDFIEISKFIQTCKIACLDLIYLLPQLTSKRKSPPPKPNSNLTSQCQEKALSGNMRQQTPTNLLNPKTIKINNNKPKTNGIKSSFCQQHTLKLSFESGLTIKKNQNNYHSIACNNLDTLVKERHPIIGLSINSNRQHFLNTLLTDTRTQYNGFINVMTSPNPSGFNSTKKSSKLLNTAIDDLKIILNKIKEYADKDKLDSPATQKLFERNGLLFQLLVNIESVQSRSQLHQLLNQTVCKLIQIKDLISSQETLIQFMLCGLFEMGKVQPKDPNKYIEESKGYQSNNIVSSSNIKKVQQKQRLLMQEMLDLDLLNNKPFVKKLRVGATPYQANLFISNPNFNNNSLICTNKHNGSELQIVSTNTAQTHPKSLRKLIINMIANFPDMNITIATRIVNNKIGKSPKKITISNLKSILFAVECEKTYIPTEKALLKLPSIKKQMKLYNEDCIKFGYHKAIALFAVLCDAALKLKQGDIEGQKLIFNIAKEHFIGGKSKHGLIAERNPCLRFNDFGKILEKNNPIPLEKWESKFQEKPINSEASCNSVIDLLLYTLKNVLPDENNIIPSSNQSSPDDTLMSFLNKKEIGLSSLMARYQKHNGH